MAFVPIANSAIQYYANGVPALDHYIKLYLPGTSTPISMFSDDAGGGALAKCQIDADGYPLNGTSAVFIPYIDQNYKIALFQNETAADANDFGSTAWVIDDLDARALTDVSGFVDWSVTTTYAIDDYVKGSDDVVYIAVLSSTGVNPVGDVTGTWRRMLQFATELVRGEVFLADQAEAEAGTEDTKAMTSLKVQQSITENATAAVDAATASAQGKVELAIDAEAIAASDATRAVTPANLAALRTLTDLQNDGLWKDEITGFTVQWGEVTLGNLLQKTNHVFTFDTAFTQLYQVLFSVADFNNSNGGYWMKVTARSNTAFTATIEESSGVTSDTRIYWIACGKT